MGRVISIHEYELKPGVRDEDFQEAVLEAESRGLFQLPGLVEYYFVKGIRGSRSKEYAAFWIYKNRTAWEQLWGSIDLPIARANYPASWKAWEDEILAPLLSEEPDKINYTAYEEWSA